MVGVNNTQLSLLLLLNTVEPDAFESLTPVASPRPMKVGRNDIGVVPMLSGMYLRDAVKSGSLTTYKASGTQHMPTCYVSIARVGRSQELDPRVRSRCHRKRASLRSAV